MKNKFIIVMIIISFAFANSVFAAEVFYNYAKGIGGTGSDSGRSIAIDSNGNTYVTGNFAGTVDFDPGTGTTELTSAGSNDIFITKFDSSGNFVWVKQIGSAGDESRDWIAIDSSNNLYITGGFLNTIDFDFGAGTAELTSAGSDDAFILKLDSDGVFIWVKQMGGAGSDFGNHIVLDASGNIYTTGYFTGTVDFDPSGATSNITSGNVYIQKLTSDGVFVWAKAISYASWYFNPKINIDNAGSVYMTSYFTSTTDFDPGAGTTSLTATNCDGFLLKLDSNGIFAYVKRIGGSDCQSIDSVAFDSDNNLYISGTFIGTVDFDPGAGTYNLTYGGTNDLFLLKLDSNGDFVWVKQYGTGWSGPWTTRLDSSGNIYIAGEFWTTYDFDPGVGVYSVTSAGNRDAYILKLDSSGDFLYVKTFGSTGADAILSFVLDSNGKIYLTGFFNSTTDFDPSSSTANLTSAGDNDIFISVLAPDTTAPTITSVSTSNITNTSVTITWTTNEESSTLVEYSLDSSYSTSTAETDTSTRVTSHTVSLSNLNPCTSYQYRVKSNDSSSNLATDTNHTLEMPGCQNSSTSAGSRAYNLFAMGKTQEAKDIVTQFPNALDEIKDEDVKKELTTDTSPSSSNPSSTITFTKTIKKGTVSPLVSTIQKVIGVNPDGKFGPITLKAVKEFQSKNNLKSDGIVGPKTWAVVSSLVK